MAKGFTVKTSEQSQPKLEWDYDSIKKRMRGKVIVFCLPGRGCSFTFMKAFVQLCFDLVNNQMGFVISQDYSSMVNFARCKCLGANVLNGPDQLPFDGKINYDYQMWIDSDIVFNTEKFWQLCDLAIPEDAVTYEQRPHTNENGEQLYTTDQNGNTVPAVQLIQNIDNTKTNPIVSGWYCTEDGVTTSCAHWRTEEEFRKHRGVMNHETLESIEKRRKPFSVDYVGFGWVMIQKGVFEHPEMKYPWFAPQMQVFESGEVQDMCGEDVSFCLEAKKKCGFDILVDPRIRVGHEKTRII